MIKILKKITVLLAVISFLITPAYAGEDSEEELRLEISYLAKKLLDLSGKDELVVEAESLTKPFIGICTSMKTNGISLTCITPESQAAKGGLQTGDLVTSINGKSMANQKSHHWPDGSYWRTVGNMKIGDKLEFEVVRAGDKKKVAVTVGSLVHPAYRLEIKR